MTENCMRSNNALLGKIILSIALLIGLLGLGYFIASAVYKFRAQESFVTVKGLATREVKANLGVWEIACREVGDNLVTLGQQLAKSQQSIIDFLKAKGFSTTEISLSTTKVTDVLADPYSNTRNSPEALQRRYILTGSVLIRSTQVDLIQQVGQMVGELLNKGIPLSFESSSFSPNPSYFYINLDAIRPQMLAEATKSGRFVAQQFAKDSGTHLGAIRRANQGVFQIMSRDSDDENSQQQLSMIDKKVRLVTTIEYFLKR